tara:strand:+ start:25184 stop:26467 length:1284 start_codon:yes stop_codon:yes gene_type:complete
MSKIKIYDAIMGSGKTHDAIERMKMYLKEDRPFIYITPFLDEISRVKNALNDDRIFSPLSPSEDGAGKYESEDHLVDDCGNIDLNASKNYKYLNKRAQFLKMAAQGKNIITTHSLFKNLNRSDFKLFKDYVLILDEVISPMDIYKIGAIDIGILQEQDLIIIDNITNEVSFINDEYNDPAFRDIKKLCGKSSVYFLDKYFFVWVFPIEIFKEFKEVQILTYLFNGSLMSAYFKMHDVEYKIIANDDKIELLNIKAILAIYEGRSNEIVGSNSFSKTWIGNLSKRNAKKIEDTTSNVFKRVFKTKSRENAFTTFKESRTKLSGGGYSKGFIPINARASNDYRHKKSMAYLGNRFFKPQQINFFKEKGIVLDEDLWAVSELIQWVWRGCIRDGKEMNLFIPSYRMRTLLYKWLDGEYSRRTSKILIENS